VKINSFQSPAAFAGKCILITGAGGYIGTALADALAAGSPRYLVLLDNSEHSLHELTQSLREQGILNFSAVLGDVGDEVLLAEIFEHQSPEIIFHAAACKHVPLMEENPLAAMRTNALGTLRLVQAAMRGGARRLLLVSTDKAVNPASVMGATKRMAELVLQRRSGENVILQTVRLGNVLGSHGSVAPRFARQIARGGPVTVTHPEAERYFLTLNTTVEIILQLAGLGAGTFIPKLAPPVRIAALAERMIQEARKTGSKGIAVKFTEMRPGDKLREEFLYQGESSEPTADERLLRIATLKMNEPAFDTAVQELDDSVARRDLVKAMEILRALVPQYCPSELVLEILHEAIVAKT
jgi:FlaA1/EpsC-like NDP-sugar epimerase